MLWSVPFAGAEMFSKIYITSHYIACLIDFQNWAQQAEKFPESGPRTRVEPANGSRRQLTWMFRFSEPGFVDRVERQLLQQTAFANTLTMPTISPSRWKVTHVRLVVRAQQIVHAIVVSVGLAHGPYKVA